MPKQSAAVIDVIVKSSITPILRKAGYKKAGLKWRKESGEVQRFLEVQKSSGNTSDSARFTVNIALFHLGLYQEMNGNPPSGKAGMPHCRLRLRPSAFLGGLDFWWTVEGEGGAATVEREVVDYLESHALPWLEGAETLEHIQERAVSNQDFHTAAVASFLLGKPDAEPLLRKAVDELESVNKRYAAMVREWGETRKIL